MIFKDQNNFYATLKTPAIIFVCSFLISCTTGKYQSYQSGVGYQSFETDKTENEFLVTYTGTRTTSTDKVNDFALLRCAELTLEKGFNYFVVTEAINNKSARSNRGSHSARGVDHSAATSNYTTLDDAPKARTELTISIYKEKPEDTFYEAAVLAIVLKDEYGISKNPFK